MRQKVAQPILASTQSKWNGVAEANLAVLKENLAVLKEQERKTTELQKLEYKSRQSKALIEFENLTQQQAMQDKSRKLECLE